MFQKEVSLYSISLETSPILPPEINIFFNINDSVLSLDEMRQLSEFSSSWATLPSGWGKGTWHDPTTYSGPKQYLDTYGTLEKYESHSVTWGKMQLL